MPSSLHLFNTYSRRVEQFCASDPANVTFYTCGPTVYDDAHIGNFRSFLAADVLRRWIESPLCVVGDMTGREHRSMNGRRVTHVMNITDVGHMTDDAEGGESGEDRMAVAGKRIAEAKKSGKLPQGTSIDPTDPYQIARFYEDRFKDDARTLGLKLALQADKDKSLMPRATENVAGMIEVVQRLIDANCAYVVGSAGSRVVYFSVQSFQTYGQLSGNTIDALREGEGGRISASNQSQKKHPADFLLWKEDPSHIMKWDSPWGKGYPGWHIECTVMSLRRLRTESTSAEPLHIAAASHGSPLIDLHSGGEDNIFPHHECEIAQSCCAYSGCKGSFAAMWFHPRFLLVEGMKMSKSKGNFFTARDLFAKGIEPAALRLELIRTHYRSNANFTMQGLTDSQRMVDRWRRFEDAAKSNSSTQSNAAHGVAQERTREDFAASLHDDLNIAGAIAAVNTYVGAVESPNSSDLGMLKLFDDVFGVLSLPRPQSAATEIGVWAPGLTPDAAVEALLLQRRDARAAKDFKASDVIRDKLAAMGFAIKDMAGGKVEVRRMQ